METPAKVGCGAIFAFVALTGGCTCLQHSDRDVYKATVTEKQVKRAGDSDSYLIYTELENGETRVFENTDSIIEGKWNSSDIWPNIEKGNKYEFKTYGWRIPLFSGYENIIGYSIIENNKQKVLENITSNPDTRIYEGDLNGNGIPDKYYIINGRAIVKELDGRDVTFGVK